LSAASPLLALPGISTLPGRGVTLRPLRPNDASSLWAYWSDPEVYGPTSLDVRSLAMTAEALQGMNDAFARGEAVRWGIVPEGSATVMGDCGFFNVSAGSAEIGYLLARPCWGRGIASEAVDLMLTFAFDTLRLHEVQATVMDGNERSLRLLESKGFERIELLPAFRWVRGAQKDFWLLRFAR
jgi:ribosomal-protein-alanine N-acetyltransferase